MYFISYFQNTFKNYFLKFKILFPKCFSQNTLHNIFSRKPLSFRLSWVTVCQTFLQFLIYQLPIQYRYQYWFAYRKFWIVAAQLYGLHAPRRRRIWRIWYMTSRFTNVPNTTSMAYYAFSNFYKLVFVKNYSKRS